MASGGLLLRVQERVALFLCLGEGGSGEALGNCLGDLHHGRPGRLLHEGRLYLGELAGLDALLHLLLEVQALLEAGGHEGGHLFGVQREGLRLRTGIFLLHLTQTRNASKGCCLLSGLKVAQYLGFQLPATIGLGDGVGVAHLEEQVRFDLAEWISELRLVLQCLEILFVLLL